LSTGVSARPTGTVCAVRRATMTVLGRLTRNSVVTALVSTSREYSQDRSVPIWTIVIKKLKLIYSSSPEHEVLSELLWSFNVRRPASVVCASVRASTMSLNNISSETAYWILTKLHRNDPWVVPYQSCSNRSSWLHK